MRRPLARTGVRRQPRFGLPAWAVCAAAVVITLTMGALAGSGGVYALWSSTATAPGAQIQTGTAGLAVDDGSSARLDALSAVPLGPGDSMAATAKVSNVATTPLNVSIATTDVSTAEAVTYLRLRTAPVASSDECRAAARGEDADQGTSGALATYSSGAAPFGLAAGSDQLLCVVVTLASDAPVSVADSTVDFTLTVTGSQAGS